MPALWEVTRAWWLVIIKAPEGRDTGEDLYGLQLGALWSSGTLSEPSEPHPWQGADSYFAPMDGENSLLALVQHLHLALVCVLGSSAFGSPSWRP